MIRIIAFLSMLIDHIGQVFFPNIILFHLIGRVAFPIFAYGIATGYKRTRNIKNYAFRLLILAIISQFPYSLLFKNYNFNVCFTLLLGLLLLWIYNFEINKILKYSSLLFIILLSYFIDFEYGMYGILLIVIYYYFENIKFVILLQIVATTIGVILYRYHIMQYFSILSSLIILLFKKYDFKLNKLIQYGFYPIHILILLLVSYLI